MVTAAAFAFALFRDSAAGALLAEGLSVTPEFSILSEMLCDLSVSIRKKRLYLRGEKTKKKKTNTHIHNTHNTHTPTYFIYESINYGALWQNAEEINPSALMTDREPSSISDSF